MGVRTNVLAVIDTPAECREIYQHVRTVFKLAKNGCAATCSLILYRAKALHTTFWLCSKLSAALTVKGWRRLDDRSKLRKGDVCFTVDGNTIPGPDHVYIFLGWLDEARQVAQVYDNYAPQPHPRNVGKRAWYQGKWLSRGEFAYALTPPE